MTCRSHGTYSHWAFAAAFYLLVFQNPLTEYVWSGFSYVDECFALLGPLLLLRVYPQLRLQKSTLWLIMGLLGFLLCGLAANLGFRYQAAGPVLKDIYTNLKFFLSVQAGCLLLRCGCPPREWVRHHARRGILILFILLLADVLLGIFPNGGIRYGLTVRKLIFGHATYLAAACVFLISVLLLHYEGRDWIYLGMGLMVLISTLRGKALAGTAVCVAVVWRVILQKKKPGLRHLLIVAAAGVCIAWNQIGYYYIELSGQSARSVLLQTSFEIMEDYFPIGTGFGTFGSDVAREFYSPVYVCYGFLRHYELQRDSAFFSDTFWPIIMGQTGFLGTACYLLALLLLFSKALQVRAVSRRAYGAVLFLLAYLLISSTSEPTFCNSVSVPPAAVLGYAIYAASDPGKGGGRI